MIQLDNIDFKYSKKGNPVLVGITARIPSGVHLLAGENGAGKTTLLHILAGVATPTSGKCLVNDSDPASDNPTQKGNTFLVEENTSFPMKTIRKFAEAHSRFYPNYSARKFNANLVAFGLTGDEKLSSMSLGSRKKAILAYALALGVDTLLLDEPTNALDIQSREILRSLIISNLTENQTLIISTHTVSEFENLFDGGILLMGGRLAWSGTEEETAARLAFEKSRVADDEAIYSESSLGGISSILPAIPGEPTRVDWRLLYSGLHSPKCSEIMQQLNNHGNN